MAQTKQSQGQVSGKSPEHSGLAPVVASDEPAFNFAAHLRANPEIIWNDLREQIGALIEALINARIQLDDPDGATRQEIVLDLYDEELITKQDAHEQGPFEDAEFYNALLTRRRARMGLNQ